MSRGYDFLVGALVVLRTNSSTSWSGIDCRPDGPFSSDPFIFSTSVSLHRRCLPSWRKGSSSASVLRTTIGFSFSQLAVSNRLGRGEFDMLSAAIKLRSIEGPLESIRWPFRVSVKAPAKHEQKVGPVMRPRIEKAPFRRRRERGQLWSDTRARSGRARTFLVPNRAGRRR